MFSKHIQGPFFRLSAQKGAARVSEVARYLKVGSANL